MRSITGDLQGALDNERSINARMTIRDTLPRFTELTPTKDQTYISAHVYHHSSIYNSGILRISKSNSGGSIYYQYISAPPPTTAWTTNWTTVGSSCSGFPGLWSNYLWYQDITTKNIMRRQYTGSWGSASSLKTGLTNNVSIKPVDTNEAYILTYDNYDTTKDTFRIVYHNWVTSTWDVWDGCIYAREDINRDEMKWFNAIRAQDDYGVYLDYIFFRDEMENNTYYITRSNGVWSDPEPVVPLDIVDNMATFIATGSTIINSRLMLTGILERLDGPAFHVYMMGPPPFTMGKEFYITDWLVEANDQGWTMPALGGQIHATASNIWYVGPGLQVYAPITYLFGSDPQTLKMTTYEIQNITVSTESGSPHQLDLDYQSSETSELIRPGSELVLEAGYNGFYGTLGIFDILPVNRSYEQEGLTRSLNAGSKALTRMNNWICDGDYYINSQAKGTNDPGSLAHNIIISGKCEQETISSKQAMVAARMNEDVMVYSVTRASRNWIAMGKFRAPSNTWLHPQFGLLVNYQHGVDDAADYGIAFVYRYRLDYPQQKMFIYHIYNDVWTELASVEKTITLGADHWLKVEWHDGHIHAFHKQDGSVTWTEIFDYVYNEPDNIPLVSGRLSRCGFYLNNASYTAPVRAINSDTLIIPVEENGNYSVGEYVQIDDEVMEITDKSANIVMQEDNYFIDGYHVAGAEWDNSVQEPFSGYQVWLYTQYDEDTSKTYLQKAALYLKDGSRTSLQINHLDYECPQQWIPDPAKVYYAPDTWINHVGNPSHGQWDARDHTRLFLVDKPPEIEADEFVDILPALHVTRGSYDTTVVPHEEGDLSYYSSNKTMCLEFYCYSSDQDQSMENIIRDIARRSGIQNITCEMLIDETVQFAHSGYAISTDYPLYKQDRTNFILEIRLDSLTPPEFAIIAKDSGGAYTNALTFSTSYISIGTVSGNVITKTDSVAWTPTMKWIKVSQQNGHLSVWNAGKLVATFPNWNQGVEVGFACAGTADVDIRWSELDSRVDDFFYEMGSNGISLIDYVISERHVYYQDGQYGDLKVFRNRTLVNEGDPYDLAITSGESESSIDMKTRLRLEGLIALEVADFDNMREYGNYFAMSEIMELETDEEFEREADLQIEDLVNQLKIHEFTGAADLRIEPNDTIEVTLPDGSIEVIVDAVDFEIKVSEEEAIFDMTVRSRGDL